MPWHCLPNSNFKVCELVLPWVAAVDTNGSCGWAASFCKEQRCSSTAMSAVSSARAQLSGAFSSEQRAAAHSGAENGVSGAARSNGEAAPAFVIPPGFSDFSSEGFAK